MNRAFRKWHYWIGAIISIPLLFVVTTGLLLQFKKQIPWVQPPEVKRPFKSTNLSIQQVFAIAQATPQLEVKEWKDIQRIDIRPKSGIAKVISQNGWESQVELSSGKVLQTTVRRSDMIESIHDGSFFAGDWTKLGLFAASGFGLFVLIVTGLWLWLLPILVRRRKKIKVQSASE